MTDALAPLPHAPPRWLAHPRETCLAGALLFAYYALTMSRDMGFYDSPELALVAVQGGVGHPIGQPLHTLLGHVLVVLGAFVGAPALLTLNLLSALACALTLLPVVSVLDAVSPPGPGRAARLRPFVVALIGVHASLWEPATRVEVYPLGTLLGALSVAMLLRALPPTLLARPAHEAPSRASRSMAAAGLFLALATGANAVTAVFFALAMSPLVLRGLLSRALPLRALGPALLAALLGMLVWLYVPLAARDPDVVAWGRPTDWPSLRAYLSGADYVGKSVGLLSAEFGAQLLAFLAWSARVGLLALPLLGLLGFGLRARVLLPVVSVLLLANVGWYARYDPFAPGVLDYLGYLGAPLWFLAGGAALLVDWAHERGSLLHAGALATLAAVVLSAAPQPWERTRANDRFTRELAEAALDEAPPQAILVLEADHWAAPLMYLQEVEARRPDVVVLPLGLASSSWLWELLYRRHPDLGAFALRGPGGREARVRRFLDAHPTRPVFTNEHAIALRLALPACVRGVLLALEPCADQPHADGLLPLLTDAHARLGVGSPGTAGLLAWEGETRARALAAEGRARDAFAVLTFTETGVGAPALPSRVPPFELPTSGVGVDAMGSARRNLLTAAQLARMGQQHALAAQLEARAEDAQR